jgi:hypothetical protein
MGQQSNQLNLLREAIKAIPAVKYALGVAGVAAAVALIAGFRIDYKVAVFGTIIMFVLMFVLVIFSWFSKHAGHGARPLAFTLAWLFVMLIGITSTLLVSSFFFQWPRPLENYVVKDPITPSSSPSSTPVPSPISSPNPTATPNGPQSNPTPISSSSPPLSRTGILQSQVSQHINRARSLYVKGGEENYQAAIKECDIALRIDPGNREAIKLRDQIKKTVNILNR